MKKLLLPLFVSCVLVFSGAWAQPRTAPLRVVIFLSPEGPLCQNYSLPLNPLFKKYADKVQFTGVVPGKAYSAGDVNAFTQKYHIAFPVYIDSAKTMSTSLKATVTPEVFLLGPDKKVIYHGSIDNWIKDLGMQSARPTVFYLRDAIDQSLAHQPVRVPYNKPVGCLINDY
ncbi:MAG TPA: redoxin domain-containing protein [Puia sp.]|nr:redoxin domain-containing protein [Puia sp.]